MCSVCSWFLLTIPADKQDTWPTLCVFCAFLTARSVSWRSNSRWGNSWWCSNSTGDNRCRRVSLELCPLARRRPCRGCRWVRFPRSQGKTFPSKTSTSSFRTGAWLCGEELKCYGERDKSGRVALRKVRKFRLWFQGRTAGAKRFRWLFDWCVTYLSFCEWAEAWKRRGGCSGRLEQHSARMTVLNEWNWLSDKWKTQKLVHSRTIVVWCV